jgi:hypothetical protein
VLSHDEGSASIKLLNDRGYYVFMIIGPGGGADHQHISRDLRAIGAHVDDVEVLSIHSGAVQRCQERWPVSQHGSFVVASCQGDLDAIAAAGLPGHVFAGGSLLELIAKRSSLNGIAIQS